MPDLKTRFEQAQQDANSLPERPDNDTLLKLYALFKQATAGDATGEPPSSFDFIRRAKFDAWNEVRGTSAEDSMRQYIELIASLLRKLSC